VTCWPSTCLGDDERAGRVPEADIPFEQPWPLESWPDMPTRVLVGRDDRLFPAAFQRRIAQERLRITPDEMPGGHLVALAHLVELADRLEAYRTEVRDARPRRSRADRARSEG